MTNPVQSLEQAELAIILKPVDTFLTALQQPGANTENVMQDFAALQLAAIQDAPAIESVGIVNVAAAIQAKLHALVASATTAASAIAPATQPDTLMSSVS